MPRIKLFTLISSSFIKDLLVVTGSFYHISKKQEYAIVIFKHYFIVIVNGI